MRNLRWTAGVAAGCIAAVLAASGARAQSLADALVTAYVNSPAVKAERATLKSQGELAVQARAQGRLQVSGTASIDWSRRDWTSVDYPNTLSLQITQPLYSGGQVYNSTKAAEIRITAEKAVLTATEEQVLLNAVTYYYNVLRDIAFVDLGINNVRVLSEQLRAAQERFDVGEVTRTDVEQARAALASARSSLASSRGSLAASRAQYLRYVGKPPGNLAPPPPLPQLPDSLSDAIAIAVLNDPTLVSARLQREAASYDVRSAIGALLPQISLRAAATRQDYFSKLLGTRTTLSAGVQMTIPFYHGGYNYSRIRQAEDIVERDVANVTTDERDAAQAVGAAYAQLESARTSIDANKTQVQAAQLAFTGVVEEARVGARTTLDVLNAEQTVLNARANLISAQRDVAVASYSLLSAIGLLTVQHLGLDVGPVATASQYTTVRAQPFGYDRTQDTIWTSAWRP